MDEPIPKRLESVKHMQLKDADMLKDTNFSIVKSFLSLKKKFFSSVEMV